MKAICHNDLTKVALSLYNVFADLSREDYPVIGQLLETLESKGALGACMSGTGSAVFGLFGNESAAREALKALSGFAKTFLTRPIAKEMVV